MKSVDTHIPVGLKDEQFVVVIRGEETAKSVSELDLAYEVTHQGKALATADCVGSWAGPLQAIPAYLIEQHHDPACRTFSGLALVLSITNQSQTEGMTPVSALILRPRKASTLAVAQSIPDSMRSLGARRPQA